MSEMELQDAILRHSLQLMRLSAGQQREAEQIIRELERELRLLLQSQTLSEAGKREIEALVAQAEEVITPAYRAAAASVDTHAIALIIAKQTVHIIEDVIPANVLAPTAETLASLTKDVLIDGAASSAWWVRQGVVNGETNERIVQRIVGRGAEPGIMVAARRNARALVHSSVMSAANDARLATYRKNSRLISGVRWLATLDGHTCPRCAALDGQAWDLDGNPLKGTSVDFMAPPIHWNDRCVLSPIPKTFADIGLDIPEPADQGQRASSIGPLHAKTTFDQFFARQSPAQQNAQFGKTRAALFRAGKLTVKDLVSGTGRELTLDELNA
jgi:SPP1 gp7 family putative phage head morphogenesis protein